MTRSEIEAEVKELQRKVAQSDPSDVAFNALLLQLLEKAVQLQNTSMEPKVHPNSEAEPPVVTPKPVEPDTFSATPDLFSMPPEPPAPVKQEEVVPEVKNVHPPAEPPMKSPPPASKSADESVSGKLRGSHVDDLKAVIGINEKFQFINELFDGNMKEYNVALDQLNNVNSSADADAYLDNLGAMYNWNQEDPVASNFKELVQRRFA